MPIQINFSIHWLLKGGYSATNIPFSVGTSIEYIYSNYLIFTDFGVINSKS
jgi:hypothetical protein